ncbi:Transcriptional regulator HilA [Roseovarius albus]|uniref:Transcriptional regulator HilA n=1 Tax=Roseovarius albus TaxID=1247867 RepID=A0A1X7AAP2_9RHOB|nr:tetratricopeptide repeat protein [Roseovarius albus]SLN74131.1 Transcriptional regulator HilA [Roseovarius albus]
MERRLAAILAADVVGYSKLMGEDEAGTLAALKAHRITLFDPTTKKFDGRIVKLMGDGVLVEFPSVVAAVECAVAVQRALAKEDSPIKLRCGINLGDVIIEGDDIYGDGVNLAARLEALADPGGVCVSDIVYQSVHKNIEASFEDMGEQKLKNIDGKIRVWQWRFAAAGQQSSSSETSTDEVLVIPEKPSIAVLPFDNMSDDAEQEYLADGLSEDLITALSKVRWFFVIARNSTFTYKGQAVDITKVGKELGVRYVLEGSVRKAGNRVRVTVQLIEAATGNHVWAERYDRQIEDIFDLQDEMTNTIVGAIEPELSAAERKRVAAKAPENLDAWESYQRGVWHMWKYEPDDLIAGLKLLKRATDLDPNFTLAYAYMSYIHYQKVVLGCSDNIKDDLDAGMKAAQRALAIDDQDSVAYFAIGRIYMMQGQHDESIAALETAVKLNPSFAQAYHGLGMVFTLADRLEDAKASCLHSERLSPRDPIHWASTVVHALACVLSGDYIEGAHWARITIQNPRSTSYWPHAVMASSLAHLGQIDEARAEVALAIKEKPDLTLSYLSEVLPTKKPNGLDPYLIGLRKAGLPE